MSYTIIRTFKQAPYNAKSYYQPIARNEELLKIYYEINLVDDKINYLKNNKERIEKFNINVINLINSYLQDEWVSKRERNIPN